MTLSNLTIKLDRNFQKLDSISMLNEIRYIATPYYGKWYWIDDTFSIISWDGQNEVVEAKFVSKRDMVTLHRLILTGEKRYVNPIH